MNAITYAEPPESHPEIPLPGGDVTEGVVRVGDTVRRPIGPNAPLVHALLRHLEETGFEGAPRFLGVDAAGREVLTFVPGEVAGRPRPPWLADEERLASVGRLVRAYHEAVAGFVVPDGVRPGLGLDEPPGTPPPPPYPVELVGHMDYTPDNLVFRDGQAAALIDFDIAKPVTRADELVNAMLYWAPLGDPADAEPLLQGVDVPRRCRILADAYGMSETDRSRVVEVAVMRTRRSWFLMRQNAEELGGGWARMWADGVGDRIKRREAWLERHGAGLDAALTAP
ncbi:phosphotransferase [Nonomuraea gerenzanensis]|uniref:Aminoglycoside phosphotransferase n=1 Tax=Nonomuraea gerenzanensis TaxID=93944 RepID=A0A1M4EDB0_9ACTN|nr:phosphotransferase [Nonomuraea gerenzanensis]UBU08608.1 aminoglycoside phosphotransferase family protein [Nonomuraea gerenzanensis]SBO96967.1 aminoglycoside phosphotransferase [Nonomuraea gerenzanensis]